MNPDDLIRIARYLASTGTGINAGRPNQADLRRAVSTTYYALFHALARCCANTLIGATPRNRSQRAWRQTYRPLEHRRAKEQCNRTEITLFPQEIQTFAASFIDLQNRRHTADYDPLPNRSSTFFYRHDVLELITEAEQAIKSLNSA